MKEHTRNQKRMYRIHKQEEKILEQELLISSLQNQLQQKENGFYKREEFLTNNIKRLEQKVVEKENIIKEVREYIDRYEINSIGTPLTYTQLGKELLEILDKENK